MYLREPQLSCWAAIVCFSEVQRKRPSWAAGGRPGGGRGAAGIQHGRLRRQQSLTRAGPRATEGHRTSEPQLQQGEETEGEGGGGKGAEKRKIKKPLPYRVKALH